jgi:hypothetical protein
MQKRTFTRAAGVSPPWVGFALATATRFCALITFRTAQSLLVPRLAHASRSRCATCVRCKGRDLWCGRARPQERRASARRGCLTPLQSRTFTTGGLRPPLLVGTTCVRRAKATFTMHKRTCTGAAGVSPPWVGFALATATRFCALITFRPAHSFPVPRLAYASRSWCATCVRRAKATFAMNERTCTRAAGVSPPWVGNASAMAPTFSR